MTTSLPSREALLDSLIWREKNIEEAWEMDDDDGNVPDLDNAFHTTDLPHWIDLCT